MRYVGGKSRMVKDILPLIHEYTSQGYDYVEPFLGGCNILPKVKSENRLAGGLTSAWQWFGRRHKRAGFRLLGSQKRSTKPMVKPMRAIKYEEGMIEFPCIVQVKLDGVRAFVKDGVVYSRSLKPIPNKHVQKLFGHLHGFDGELMTSSDPYARVFNETTSAVMTIEGEPEVYFHVYDNWAREMPYMEWYGYAEDDHASHQLTLSGVLLHPHYLIHNETALNMTYEGVVLSGLEGIVIRNPSSPYKHGNATKKNWELVKMKPLDDAEYEVLDFEEETKNVSESKVNELGYKQKSHKKADKVPCGILSSFWCEHDGYRFKVPVRKGHTDEERKQMWENKDQYLGKFIKVAFEGIAKNAPRFPRFEGFRNEEDME